MQNRKYLLKIFAVLLFWPVLAPALAQADGSRSVCAAIRLDEAVSAPGIKSRSLTAVVGDSVAVKFQPKLELKAWEGECSFKIDLKTGKASSVLSVSRDSLNFAPRINFRPDGRRAFSIYRLPDGDLEWEIRLDSLPGTNLLAFDFEATNLLFYYQDTAAFGADVTYEGPEWAYGSYAVYHATRRHNRIIVNGPDTTREIYSTGKVFHIRRPQAFDSNGDTVWCDINIDTNSSELTISIPQNFLDGADYPVIIDPTFGKTSIGAWDLTATNYRHIVLWNVGAAETGEGEITGGYVYCNVDGDPHGTIQVKVHSYSKGLALNDSKFHASSLTTDVTDTAGHWVECSMSGALSAETTYIATVQAYSSIVNKLKIRGDVAVWGDIRYSDVGSWNVPDSLTGYGKFNEAYSVYVEYVVEAEGTLRRRRRIMQSSFGNNYLPEKSPPAKLFAQMSNSRKGHMK